jgi:hypothetical protein
MLRYNLRENVFGLSKKAHTVTAKLLHSDYDKMFFAGLLVLFVVLVVLKFGSGLIG